MNRKRIVPAVITVTGLVSLFMCAAMVMRLPVRAPLGWVIGLIVFLLYGVYVIARIPRCQTFSAERFEALWRSDPAKRKGFFYRDHPGCYVILIYRHKPVLPFSFGYENVYAGQSLEVYRRVHNHLNRKGNGDVYADRREGKYIEIEIYPCRKEQLNELEIALIRRYRAESYYNRTAGGGKKRKRFGR